MPSPTSISLSVLLAIAISPMLLSDTPADGAGADAVVHWNEIGRLQQAESKLDEAEQAFRHALRLSERLANPSKMEVAVILNNLGTLSLARGQYKLAETPLRQSYSILETNHLLETEAAGALLTNLALDLQQQGRNAEALPFYNLAFTAFRVSASETTLEYAKLLTNSGQLSFEMGRIREAVGSQRKAIEIQNALPSVDNLNRAHALNNLASALAQIDDLVEAQTLLSQAIELLKNSDPTHLPRAPRQLVETLNNLAVVERRAGHRTAAVQHAQEALDVASTRLSRTDPLLAGVWNTLGMIALEKNDLRQARESYEKSAALLLEISGRESAKYAAALSNLATIEAREGHRKQAQSMWQAALAIDESQLGPTHLRVASDLANLAVQSFYNKKYAGAIDLYRRAASIQEQSLGAGNRLTASTWRNLAIVYRAAKQYDEAHNAYQRAIHAFETSPGASLELLYCLRQDEGVLRILKRFADAEQTEVRALRIEVRQAIDIEKHKTASPSES
jgi:tetratricopeptide (TPR) repeat protein